MDLLPFRKTRFLLQKNTNKIITTLAITSLILLACTRLNNHPVQDSPPPPSNNHPPPLISPSPPHTPAEDIKMSEDEEEKCDIFTGEWVPNPDAPYYTNRTCWAIHEHQNCMKYGRPDTGFMKWRWKPDGCDLRVFNPFQFLDIVRDKSLAFVGDSVGRNQMQSMICLLSRLNVNPPTPPPPPSDRICTFFSLWLSQLGGVPDRRLPDNRRTLQTLEIRKLQLYPRLLLEPVPGPVQRARLRRPTHTGLFNLYLDEYDDSWTTQIDEFDYVIINAGHWLTRTAVYYENGRVAGCRYCQLPDVTDLPTTYGYRRVFRTAFKAINERENFKGVVFLRTFAPSHFENGLWNAGGNCEFRAAEKEGKKRLRLLDTTQAMLLRPDGHPSRYGHWPNENVTLYNDCVHWCLPGPIDSWADLLLHMMKMEARRWHEERQKLQ
ncbi:UNVERIFIED_CONTAM: protein trichome birefringence-like 19 [Sesamum calycinum]|uniref:Protein trichome birefringence-like 19 n=1 Tax=Sesamum calycinum TaxID=2727403 RepID=A0AAW2SW44_9LAMI